MDNIQIIRSNRRDISVKIRPNLQVVVRAPLQMRGENIHRFLWEKRDWLEKHLQAIGEQERAAVPALSAEEIRAMTDQAQGDIPRPCGEVCAHRRGDGGEDHHPPPKNQVGVLFDKRRSELQLPADALPGEGARLRGGV